MVKLFKNHFSVTLFSESKQGHFLFITNPKVFKYEKLPSS